MSKFQLYSQQHLEIKTDRNLFFIKDPIHKEIIFSQDQFWLYELVNTYEFQRLHRIKQLGFTYLNFPSAIHTRFTHCLGTYHLCNQFISQFVYNKELCPQKNKYEIDIALASALLHDIGHGPFSHAFEKAWNFSHELIGLKILQDEKTKINFLLKKKAISENLDENFYISEISKILNKTSKYTWIVDLISSEIDIDRLDYISRDSYFSGLSYGNIDLTLLIKWSSLKEIDGKKYFLFLDKAKYIIYNFLISRQYMYLELYQNKISNLYETLLIEIIFEFKKIFPEIKDKETYKSISFLTKDFDEWDISDFLLLNDENFEQIIDLFSKSDFPRLKNLSNLFLSYEKKTDLKVVFLTEKNYENYIKFSEENFDSEDFLSENIFLKKSNISESIVLWNSELKKRQKFSLNLVQEKNQPQYFLILKKLRYDKLIKYRDSGTTS